MKNTITLLAVMFFITSFGLKAQNLSLSHEGNPILNGATVDISGSADSVLILEAKVHNDGTSAIDVKVRKEEVSIVPNSMNTFCFAGNCFGGTTTVSVSSVSLSAGASDDSFSGDYYPLGNSGTSVIRYTFFNVADQNDTISFTARYSGEVGIDKQKDNLLEISSAYPNPAAEKVLFNYHNLQEHQTVQVVLRDLAGRIVREVDLFQGNGTLELDLSAVESGVYLYSIKINNQTAYTRKLVVKK